MDGVIHVTNRTYKPNQPYKETPDVPDAPSHTKKLLRVLAGEAEPVPPIWLMRQAGRYLPEYRKTREKAGSFLDLCYNPELAEEVTLQPIRRFGFDAAILFADILLIPQALGADLRFVQGEGPRLSTVTSVEEINSLKPVDEIDETLSPIYETVSRLSRSLPQDVTLIGFAGAPWTVATYMVAGRGTPDQAPARRIAFENPDAFGQLIDRITEATISYLSSQIDAGAEVVKIFDSWAGSLADREFIRWSLAPATRIVRELKQRHPGVPIIGFPKGAGLGSIAYASQTGIDCLAIDAASSISTMRAQVGSKLALQGNLDPLLMVIGGEPMIDAARRIVDEVQGTPHVFNLGHGITPDANPAHVETLIEAVRR